MNRPKAMAELAQVIKDMPSADDLRLVEGMSRPTPQMSDKFRHAFLDRVQNRDQAGLKIVRNEDKTVVRIYDVIGWPFIMADQIAEDLDGIDTPEIEVQINSPGGDAFDGIAIFNALRTHPAKVTTRVDGLAASAASIIAQAGDHRIMLEGTEMMIHEAWGITIGPKGEHSKSVEVLDKLDTSIADLYGSRAGQDGFLQMMEDETWFTPEEAIDAGLADEAVKPEQPPQDSVPKKFVDQLEAAIAAVEEVIPETENVVTFRSEQGKPPLSDDAVALVARAKAALNELTGVAQPTSRREELLGRVAEARAQLADQTKRMKEYQ